MKFLEKTKAVASPLNEACGCLPVSAKTGKILLGRRSNVVDYPGLWTGWGGHREVGEEREQTVERELREETGYEGPMEIKFICSYDRPEDGFRYHNYWAVVPEEFWPKLNHEADSYEWVDMQKTEEWPRPWHPGFNELFKKLWSVFQIKGLKYG